MARRAARPPETAARTVLPRRIGHVLVCVRDMKKAVAFYRNRLGLACTHESAGWSEFATEGCTLALHHADDATPRDTGISFNVGNVDDTVRALRRARVRIVQLCQM